MKNISFKKFILFIFICISFACLDIYIKNFLVNYLNSQNLNSISLSKFFNITLAYNTGAAFSLLSEFTSAKFLFIAFAIAAICLFGFFSSNKNEKYFNVILAGLISAGAAANAYERVTIGKVTDYLHLHYLNYNFPIFNLADILIFICSITYFYAIYKNPIK